MTSYVYLFVRADLSRPQQIIQVAHAVANLPYHDETAGAHAVLFEVRDENALLMAHEFLNENEIDHAVFYEPDVNGYTAMATIPLVDDRRILRKFKMMKENAMM